MPRSPRIVMPNYPHHIVHRGHNGQSVFFHDEDRNFYLRNLLEWKEELGCLVYSFCLMSNHVHLIINPGSDKCSLGLLMKRLAGRHTMHVNRSQNRSGSLWQGRYYSSPIDVEAYLLMCLKYVEQNPVRAGLVSHPGQYSWSSYWLKLEKKSLRLIDEDPVFKRLGRSRSERQRKYKELMSKNLSQEHEDFIRTATARCQLTGDDQFIYRIYEKTGVRVPSRGRGRPKNRSVPFSKLDLSPFFGGS